MVHASKENSLGPSVVRIFAFSCTIFGSPCTSHWRFSLNSHRKINLTPSLYFFSRISTEKFALLFLFIFLNRFSMEIPFTSFLSFYLSKWLINDFNCLLFSGDYSLSSGSRAGFAVYWRTFRQGTILSRRRTYNFFGHFLPAIEFLEYIGFYKVNLIEKRIKSLCFSPYRRQCIRILFPCCSDKVIWSQSDVHPQNETTNAWFSKERVQMVSVVG